MTLVAYDHVVEALTSDRADCARADQALKRAVMREVFNALLQELDEGKPPN